MITLLSILFIAFIVAAAIAIRSFIWRDNVQIDDICYYGFFKRCVVVATDTNCCNYGYDHWCTTVMVYVSSKDGRFWIDVRQLYIL